MFSSCWLLITHLVWLFLPYGCEEKCWIMLWPIIMNGIEYALFTSILWPAVGLVVKKNMMGTAYGNLKKINLRCCKLYIKRWY